MSEFIRLQANGIDAFPDASTQNTYRPNGTSVENALVALESNVTTLGGVAGDAKTLAEQNSVKIATAEQEISGINSSLTLDFTNASSDVQDVNTLLQNLLDRFYPSITYLFDNGNQYTDITGGWSMSGWVRSGSTLSEGTFDGSTMSFNGVASGKAQMLATINTIDLTNYSKLKFNITSVSGDLPGQYFITTNKVVPTDNPPIISSSGIKEIDISSYKGEYYIGFISLNNSSRSMSINSVWLE